MPLTRYHATAFLDPRSSQQVEELRRAWDPVMAQQIAAHITLTHVTIVHPRTSRQGEQAWNELAAPQIDIRFIITEAAITAYDGQRWPTLQTIPLTGPRPGVPGQEAAN